MDRLDHLDLYSGGFKEEPLDIKQIGGGPIDSKSKHHSYSPNNFSNESIKNLLKENRFLHRVIERLQTELDKETIKNKKLQMQLDVTKL